MSKTQNLKRSTHIRANNRACKKQKNHHKSSSKDTLVEDSKDGRLNPKKGFIGKTKLLIWESSRAMQKGSKTMREA